MRKVLLTFILVACAISAMAQWTDNTDENNRITAKDAELYETVLKVLPDGTSYFLFNRPYQGSIVTFLQIIDKEGKLLFPEEGKIISQHPTRGYTVINDLIMTDKDNNAVIIAHDYRNSNDELRKMSYTAYKVSPTGEMLWGNDGIDLNQGRSFDIQAALRMVQTEDGSYVFAWMNQIGEIMYIQMQRLSASGEIQWDNYLELKDDAISYAYPYLTNAGNNQVNLVYAKGTNQDIMVRKIDFDGSNVWPKDVLVYRGGFPNIPLHVILNVVRDPKGGVFISWYDDRSFTNKESSYVSYVKPNGTLAFASGEQGECVGYSDLRTFGPEMIYDETEDCLFLIWRETNENQSYQRIMAQKMAMTGELKWGPGGVEVSPLDRFASGYYSIQSAGPGEMAAFYMLQHAAGYGDVQAYAVRLDKDGNRVWGENPAVLASSHSEKNSLTSSPLINNSYWLAMWEDQRTFTTDPAEKKIGKTYLQKVNLDGTFGGSTSITTAKTGINTFNAYQNPAEDNFLFTFDNEQQGLVDISIYSISGQKVAIACHQTMDKGNSELTWNAQSANIAGGVYLATLTTASGSQSVRIIIK